MKSKIRYVWIGLVVILSPILSKSQSPTQGKPPSSKSTHAVKTESEGVRIFKANCSRCHTTPDGFSPRISGTVVRHMRVRASLSRHDEETLLRFFNP